MRRRRPHYRLVAAIVGFLVVSFGLITAPSRASAAAATQLVLSGYPPSVTAGQSFTVTVTAEDGTGTTDTGYAGTVKFSSTDTNAAVSLPTNYTFTAGNAGVHTFNVTLATAASPQTVTVTDTATASITGTTTPITVSPGPTTKLAVTAPSSTAPNTAFGVTVTAMDAYANLTPAYAGRIHFTSSDTAASVVLPPDYQFVAGDNGSHAFTGVKLQTTGNQTVTATDTVTSSIAGSATVNVSTADPTQLVFVAPPATATAGTTFPLELKAEYADGTVDVNYAGTVTFGSSDAKAVFPSAAYTFTSTDKGDAHLSGFALETAGLQHVTATDSTLSLTGNTGPITVAAAATAGFSFAPSPVPAEVAGNAFSLTLAAVDAYGNVTPNYTGTVHFTSTSTPTQLPADFAFTAADGGSHVFTPGTAPGGFTLYQTGSTITATDTATPAISTSTAPITLTTPSALLSPPATPVQIARGGSIVDFSVAATASGSPLTIPSDPVTQSPTTYGIGAYSLSCPSYLTCTLQTTTLSGTSPFALAVKVVQNTDGYFDPGPLVSLSLGSPTTGDVALPAAAAATADIVSEVSPPPGLDITVGSPNSVVLPAGGTMNFPLTLTDASSNPVVAGAPIQVNYTVSCPLPSPVITCSPNGSVTIPAGQSVASIPVAVSSVIRNAYFPALPVTVQLTSPVGPYGTQISVAGTGQVSGSITTTVAPPVVTLVEPSGSGDNAIVVPAEAGSHGYVVELSPAPGNSGPVQVAVPLTVTYTAGGQPGFTSCAEPNVDFSLTVGTIGGSSCSSETSQVTIQPSNGIDPTSAPITVDFLTRSTHSTLRYFQLALTGVDHGTLGAPATADTVISDNLTDGYWLVGTDGGVFTEGAATFHGSAAGTPLASPVLAIAPTPTGRGYWLVTADGGVFSYGDAGFYGSAFGYPLDSKIVGIAASPSGRGYWLVSSDGGVFAFGDARFYGSLAGIKLVGPIVGIDATRDGGGYYMVGSDGGVFTFGDAQFHGSLPVYCGVCAATSPVLGISIDLSGNGYWVIAQNGGVFAFGDAKFYGSAFEPGGTKSWEAITSTLDGGGYWLLARDGTVQAYGDATYRGSVSVSPNAPLENMAGD